MSISEKFEVIAKIGEGTYGIVYKVREVTSKKEFAMKVMKNESDYHSISQSLIREISILRYINHDNIIPIIDYSFIPEENSIKIYFPFYELSLYTLIRKSQAPKQIKKMICFQLLQGLDALHS